MSKTACAIRSSTSMSLNVQRRSFTPFIPTRSLTSLLHGRPYPIASNTCIQAAADGSLPLDRTEDKAHSPTAASPAAEASPSWWANVKEWFTGAKEREKLARLGMAAFLSYGACSNITYGICLTIAWVTFVQQKGVSPLANGQWAPFLAFYAGLWTLQNIVRPARFAFAIAMAPVFDRAINWVSERLGCDKKAGFAILLVCMAVATSTGLFSAIYFFGGFPDGIGPFPPLKRF